MSHPFFDASAYPWHREDARKLHLALYTSIGLAGRIELLYTSCAKDLPPLAQPAAADLMWKQALETLASAMLLKTLGDRLAEQAVPAVHAAFKCLVEAVDPLREPGIASGRIILDRENFREILGQAAQQNSPLSVVLVRGGDKSGRSWSRHIVNEQAVSLGAENIYLCDGIVATVEDALDQIFSTLGGDPPPKLTTEDAWFRKICGEMSGLASVNKQKYWLVVDDLGLTKDGPKIDPLIRQLFEQVALNMLNPAFAKWFKLILLDYPDGQVPTKWKGFWAEDRPTDSDIQASAVSHYLLRWAAHKNQVLTEEDAQKSAADIILRADAPQPADSRSRLQRIHDEVELRLETK